MYGWRVSIAPSSQPIAVCCAVRVHVDDLLDVAAELEQMALALEIDARLRQPRAQLERGLARLLAIARGVELAEHLDPARSPAPRRRRPASGSARSHSSAEDLLAVELAHRQPERLQLRAQRVDVRLALARRAPMLADAALQRRARRTRRRSPASTARASPPRQRTGSPRTR